MAFATPGLGIDDYAGPRRPREDRRRLADSVPGVPTEVAAHLKFHAGAIAGAQGAIGVIQIDDATSAAGPIQRFTNRPVVDWVDAQGRTGQAVGDPGPIVALVRPGSSACSSERAASRRRSARTPRLASAFAASPFRARMTRLRRRAIGRTSRAPKSPRVLPGADPRLAREHVVLMAHLDHLGLDKDAKPGEDNDLQRRARQCRGRRDDDRGGPPIRRVRQAAAPVGDVHRQHRRGIRAARRRLFLDASDRPRRADRRARRSRHAAPALRFHRRRRVRGRSFDAGQSRRRGRSEHEGRRFARSRCPRRRCSSAPTIIRS